MLDLEREGQSVPARALDDLRKKDDRRRVQGDRHSNPEHCSTLEALRSAFRLATPLTTVIAPVERLVAHAVVDSGNSAADAATKDSRR